MPKYVCIMAYLRNSGTAITGASSQLAHTAMRAFAPRYYRIPKNVTLVAPARGMSDEDPSSSAHPLYSCQLMPPTTETLFAVKRREQTNSEFVSVTFVPASER